MGAGPVISVICLFSSIVIIWGGVILSRHKERMTILEKGVGAEEIKSLYGRPVRPYNPRVPLMWGIVFTAIGLAVLLSMILISWYNVDEGIIPGLIVLFGGIGLILFHVIAGRNAQQ